jgi:hypothetical protein
MKEEADALSSRDAPEFVYRRIGRV